jgi:collagenase-like PrtC family protease
MRLSVGANWDWRLLEETAAYDTVTDFFGASPVGVIGGLPPDRVGPNLARFTKETVEEYIREIHRQGRTFTYVLNEPTMGSREFRPEVVRSVRRLLDWISEQAIENVTIAIPHFIRLVRRHYPQLKIKTSFNAMTQSVEQARMFEDMGVSLICLHLSMNLDFEKLRAFTRKVSVPLQLLAPENVVRSCVNMHNIYHTNTTCALSSGFFGAQPDVDTNRVVTYVQSWCHYVRLWNPDEILKGGHIRPEDIHHYEALGIQDFKLSPRSIATDGLVRRVKAYSARKYDGNLLDIINVFPFWNRFFDVDPKVRPALPDHSVLRALEELRQDPDWPRLICVDNRKLDGFLDRFIRIPCAPDCTACGYCREWADRAVTVQEELRERFTAILKNYRQALAASEQFADQRGPTEPEEAQS